MTPVLRPDPILGLLHLLSPQPIPLLLDPLLGLLLSCQPQVALLFHPFLLDLPVHRLLSPHRGRLLLQFLSSPLLILAELRLLAILLLLCALPNVVVFHGDSCTKGTGCTRHGLCGNAHRETGACTANAHLVSSTRT
jgi:hypothetical protein